MLQAPKKVCRQVSNRHNRVLCWTLHMREVLVPIPLWQLTLHIPVTPCFNAVTLGVPDGFDGSLCRPRCRQSVFVFPPRCKQADIKMDLQHLATRVSRACPDRQGIRTQNHGIKGVSQDGPFVVQAEMISLLHVFTPLGVCVPPLTSQFAFKQTPFTQVH